MRFLASVLFLVLACGSAAADGMVGTLAVARREPVLGWEMELGYRLQIGAFALNVMPVGGILYQSSSSGRFRQEPRSSSNGSNIGYACVDTQTGQSTYAGFCAGRLAYAGSMSGDLMLTGNAHMALHLGAGFRLGRETDGFGLLRLEGERGVGLQVRVGPNYWSLGGSYRY
ncbi:hypothetical protein [Pelomonas sp. SE-A7]|uniref:hypothetical protein n=1 Tax=Pelomonas sp. SE-A7 TaxID=3054953 RepID=UPI00259D0800|nr:hypothetical protein [Pelomonas sp. SE-A7]MDM4768347.1 hypothetical protein [Pelomonas sp. SE-A7]